MPGLRPFPAWLVVLTLILIATACQRSPHETNAGPSAPSSAQRFQSVPRHDLTRDEEAGGHTLRKHVGQSDDQLRERLQREPHIAAASTYTDRETAECVVGLVLQENRDKIARWLSRRGGRPNLVLDYGGPGAAHLNSSAARALLPASARTGVCAPHDPAQPIGRTLRRGENRPQPCSHAVVILRWSGDSEYYVLTSYPECR